MTLFGDIIAGGQFRADLQSVNRVLQTEWVTLVNEAILAVWHRSAAARPDFQIKSFDVTITSGASASFGVPLDFYGEVDLVYGPDTPGEYSLGPFAWQNRRAPGAWWPPFTSNSAIGGTRGRLMGRTIYIEPALRAGGPYRLWYCPMPKTCNFIVRMATTGSLAVTASGSGVGKTLTSIPNLAFAADGVTAALGDRVLVKNQAAPVDNGIYVVSATGQTGVSQFVLTRATDYDQASADGVYVGNVVMPTEGTSQANLFFELTAFGTNGFGTIDTDAMTFSAATVDPVLDPFGELLKIKTAIPAINRDDRNPAAFQVTEQKLENELTTFFRQVRTSNVPGKMVDTDQMGPRTFPWGAGW